ncbi:CGG triplet repeat-binding protein 1 [Rhizophagus irregularis DAOM 181602=DAOM 197198]|nr:CGG triplet repeat-binding protein 1 [Rhizophagus irregularis DAOM 181602=DAOM 197198]
MVKHEKKVTVYTRAAEHPEKKSTVDDHVRGPVHCAKKAAYEKKQRNGEIRQQRTITSTISIADSKKELIEDLIQALATANIPLEKVNSLIPFFRKHVKQGGFIPQAPTLCQMYLPQIFENHLTQLKLMFESKPVAITMDETTDDCARSVVNTLFHFRTNTKLVSVDFLIQVNNSTIGSTLLTILTKYNIPFSLPHLFISDSAAYMKKCFREVLKPVMPQLIYAPCCAHILNLIGETWQKFNPFAILKEFLAKVKECFVRSPARRGRYLTHLRNYGISSPCKIPLPTSTRWNSWFKMVEYTKIHILYWNSFFQDEVTNDSTNETLKNILKTLSDPFKFGTISVYIHFISIYARQFIQDTDFFQKQNKPIFPFVEGRLNHFSAFLESNCNFQDFGPDLDNTIISHYFNPPDFYPVFRLAFEAAFNKFNAHIPSHPTLLLEN